MLTQEETLKLEAAVTSHPGIGRDCLIKLTGVGAWKCRQWLKNRKNTAPATKNEALEQTRCSIAKKKSKEAMLELATVQEALDAMTTLRNTPPAITPIKHINHDGREATAVMLVSDLHVDETVDPAVVNGLNKYNHDIAADSIRQIFSNGLTLVAKERNAITINELYIGLLGDMLSGTIHEELLENNNSSPIEALLFLQDSLASGLQHALDRFDGNITVVCCCGNHGRTTQKIRHATQVQNSYEYLLYCNLRHHFSRNGRIKFIIEKGYLTYTEIYGKVVRWHHGHDIRYQGGIGGITIPLNRKIERWNRGKRADLDLMGHFHMVQDGGNYIINGSAMGYNAYAVKIGAAFEPPKQTFLLLDNKHWKTVVAPILIDR